MPGRVNIIEHDQHNIQQSARHFTKFCSCAWSIPKFTQQTDKLQLNFSARTILQIYEGRGSYCHRQQKNYLFWCCFAKYIVCIFMIFFLMRPMGANLKNIPKMINVSLQNVFFLLQGIGHKESQELNSANTDGQMGRGGAMVRFTTVLVVVVISTMGRSFQYISIKRNILNCINFIGLLFAASSSSSYSVYQDATINFLWPSE